jgi:hypothetical protein
MSNVVQFERPKKTPMEQQQKLVEQKSNEDIYLDVVEDVIGEWQVAASKNRLNDYIKKQLPDFALGKRNASYLNSLDDIAGVEEKLNLSIAIVSPGVDPSISGWAASFYIGKQAFSIPGIMANECGARAFNVLVYIKFILTLKSLGRTL